MSSTVLHQQNAPLFQYAKSWAFTKSNGLLILALTNRFLLELLKVQNFFSTTLHIHTGAPDKQRATGSCDGTNGDEILKSKHGNASRAVQENDYSPLQAPNNIPFFFFFFGLYSAFER